MGIKLWGNLKKLLAGNTGTVLGGFSADNKHDILALDGKKRLCYHGLSNF
jgi:hypothetical protein